MDMELKDTAKSTIECRVHASSEDGVLETRLVLVCVTLHVERIEHQHHDIRTGRDRWTEQREDRSKDCAAPV